MWGLISFLIGLIYGWASPGRQDKSSILKTGFMIGLVLGLVLAIIGYTTGFSAIGIVGGILGVVIDVVILTLLFILGVWVGDLIEGRKTRRVA